MSEAFRTLNIASSQFYEYSELDSRRKVRPIKNGLYVCAGLWSCVKVEVAVLGSPSQIVLVVSVDVKQNLTKRSLSTLNSNYDGLRAQKL